MYKYVFMYTSSISFGNNDQNLICKNRGVSCLRLCPESQNGDSTQKTEAQIKKNKKAKVCRWRYRASWSLQPSQRSVFSLIPHSSFLHKSGDIGVGSDKLSFTILLSREKGIVHGFKVASGLGGEKWVGVGNFSANIKLNSDYIAWSSEIMFVQGKTLKAWATIIQQKKKKNEVEQLIVIHIFFRVHLPNESMIL